MQIWLNGESRSMPDDARLDELLRQLGLLERRIAVEINGNIIPRSLYAGHCLQPEDRIEVVGAIGGG